MKFFSDQRLVFFFLLLLFLINCNPLLYKDAPFATEEDIDAYITRFEPIKETAIKLGLLGYQAASERKKNVATLKGETEQVDINSFRHFFIAEYALCPAILVHTHEPAKILGNFKNSEIGIETAAAKDLVVDKDYGNGVFLLSKKGTP